MRTLYRPSLCSRSCVSGGGKLCFSVSSFDPSSVGGDAAAIQSEGTAGPRKFQGLQAVGTSTVNMPTTVIGGHHRRKSFSLREWSEGQLSEAQDALRELREYDLDDPYNGKMTKADEAFLESAELHASMKSSHETLLSSLKDSNGSSTSGSSGGADALASGLGGVVLTKEQKEVLHAKLMGYRKKLRQNPFGHVKIYRSEAGGHEALPAQLSVDVNPRKLRELLNDYEGKRCILCGEAYQMWHQHQGFIPHSAREAIVFELLRPFCGTPDQILKMWWWRLHYSKRFRRIRELSHNDSRQRKKRLLYILKFLRDRQIIRESFNVNQLGGGGIVSSGRSWEFERLEFIGDNVVKYLFNDRINVLFPVHEGGVKGKAPYCQFMIDGNDGLARAYDYLEFNKLTESDRVVSKFKSDVMETLFGELQLYLWSTEIDDGAEQHQLPFTPEFIPLRAIVWHAMEELGHVMLMYHLEYVQGIVSNVVKQHNLNYIRSDPALRTNLEMQRELASSVYGARKMASQRRYITPEKVSFPFHDTALITGSGANTQKVQQIGGLLPRPFAKKDLGASHLFMEHLTIVEPAPLGRVVENALKERDWAENKRPSESLSGAGSSSSSANAVKHTTATLQRLTEGELEGLKQLLPTLKCSGDAGSDDGGQASSSSSPVSVSRKGYVLLKKGFGIVALQAAALGSLCGRLRQARESGTLIIKVRSDRDPILISDGQEAFKVSDDTGGIDGLLSQTPIGRNDVAKGGLDYPLSDDSFVERAE